MIEQSLYFTLGFLAAALLSLAVLPAFWRRAYRLSRREIEATLPLSPKEIAAERDQLRAKFAVERVQLEQQVEAIKAAKQRDMRDKGSKSVAIAGLEDDLAGRRGDISKLEARIAGLETTLAETDTDRTTAKQALVVQGAELTTLQQIYGQLQQSHGTTSDIAAQRSLEIAAHKTNLEAQLMRIEEIDRIAKNTRIELKSRTDEARATERSLREAEKDRAILTRKLESAEVIAERRAAAIAERDAKLDVLQDKAVSFAKAGKELEAALKQESRKHAVIETQLQERDQTIARLREDARQTASDLSKSIEKLRADRQKLQEDLSQTRAKAAVLQRELNGLKRASGGADLRVAGSGGRAAKQGH